MGTSNTLPGNPNTIDPPPWQSPIGNVSLPDGSLAPVVMSEAWIMYFLQQRGQVENNSGTDTLAVALSSLPNRAARASSELSAAVALLQQSIAAQTRIAKLESELGALAALMQSLTTNGAPKIPAAAASDLAALAYYQSTIRQPSPFGSSSATVGGVNEQTGAYTLLAADAGLLVVLNDASAATFKLPSSPPSATWNAWVANIGAGLLTLNPNGPNLDGSASNITIAQGQGIYVTTDGTDYFSDRGGPLPGTVISAAGTGSPILTLTATANSGIALEITDASNIITGLRVAMSHGGSVAGYFSSTGGGAYAVEAVNAVNGIAIFASQLSGPVPAISGNNTTANAGAISGNNAYLNASILGADFSADSSGVYATNAGITTVHLLAKSPTAFTSAIVYCTDCHNILDDGAAAGSVPVAGGHGAWCGWCAASSNWRIMF